MSFACPDCGKELSTEWGRDSHRSQVHDWTRMIKLNCDTCGDRFEMKRSHAESRENKFCSMDCRDEWMTTRTGEDHPCWEGGTTTYECETCGESYEGWPKDNRKYCSRDCQPHPEGEDHPRWNEDRDWWPYYGANWEEQRSKARERDGACQICGLPSWAYRCLHGKALDVHHITPFEEYEDHQEANRLDNLMTLCASCHNTVERGA